MQCEESVGKITPQRPDGLNAYILLGTTEKFRCASHSAAMFEWTVTIGNTEYTAIGRDYLSRNGVSWVTNTSYSILTFDSETGNMVTSIECKIAHDDGQDLKQCIIQVNINIYGEYRKLRTYRYSTWLPGFMDSDLATTPAWGEWIACSVTPGGSCHLYPGGCQVWSPVDATKRWSLVVHSWKGLKIKSTLKRRVILLFLGYNLLVLPVVLMGFE